MQNKVPKLKMLIAVSIFLLSIAGGNYLLAQEATLRGRVADAENREPLVGVTIVIKEFPGRGTSSDADGNYVISLPIGTYTIVASYISYTTIEVTKVEVRSNAPTILDIDMRESAQSIGAVYVIAKADMEAEKVLMVERREATVAVENLGAKEMSLKGLSTVADGIKKVTGISMEGGSKVYVRGLGDRYSMTSLNGFPIASPNPDNKLIPLTLFPTSIVKNISVSKVYQPSVFGDYSGAHINVDTKENTGKNYITLGLSVGGKIGTLFSDTYSSDKGGRGVPYMGITGGARLDRSIKDMSADQFEVWQRTNDPFKTGFSINESRAFPSIGIDFGMGRRWELGAQRLNALFALGFNNGTTHFKDSYISTINAQGVIRDNYNYDKYLYETTTTILGQIGYEFGRADHISFNVMYIGKTEDNYMRREGTDAEGVDLVGNNDTNAQKRGIRLRAGTNIKLYNAIVVGKPTSVTVATAETATSFTEGKVKAVRLK